MIPIALRTGSTRAEGFPVTIPGYEQYEFYCHNSERGGRIIDRWVVSICGVAVTEGDFATDAEAVKAAQEWLDAKKRWWAIHLLEKAISQRGNA